MKRLILLILLVLLIPLLVGSVSPVRAQQLQPKRDEPPPLSKGQAVEGQLLVKFTSAPTITYESEIAIPIPFTSTRIRLREAGFAVKGNRTATNLTKKLRVNAMRVLGQSDPGRQVTLVQLPLGGNEQAAVEQYKNTSGVEFAEPNYLVRPQFVPNDPYFQRTTGQDYQWNFHAIRMPEAWDVPPQGGSSSVKVVVIDTGVAFHTFGDAVQAPELAGVNFVSPKRFESLSSDCETPLPVPIVDDHPHDLSGHGTHATATMVQAFNNGVHAAGIAPNISIVPIKALTHCTSGPDAGNDVGTLADILAAITHGVGATAGETAVFNMSFGMDGSPLSLVFAFIALDAITQDVVVAATGNGATRTSSPPVLIPAAFPYGNVIGVGATRFDGRRAEYSQYGPVPAYPNQSAVDLVAPGGQMWADTDPQLAACRAAATTLQQELACLFLDQNNDTLPDGIVQQTIVPGNQTQFTSISAPQFGFRCLEINTTAQTVGIDPACGLYNGTSMAAPHVSAAAALMLSVNPNLTHHEIRDVLVSTASKTAIPGYTQTEHGAGLLDIAAALAAASGGTGTPTPTPTDTQQCLQVLTPARCIDGSKCQLNACQTFQNSCLPDGWVADPSCVGGPTPTPTAPVVGDSECELVRGGRCRVSCISGESPIDAQCQNNLLCCKVLTPSPTITPGGPTPTGTQCLQVLTPARCIDVTKCALNQCQTFPTSCLPDGWIADPSCAATPTPRPTGWTTTEPFQLLVGDVNDTNTITIEDISAVLTKYTDFKVPVPSGTPEDVNADGTVTIEDVALVLLNYNDFTVPGDTT